MEVILIDRGYKEIKDEEEVWWGIDLESLSSIDVPEGLEIVECTTRELFEDHLAAAMKGYGNFRFWASLLSKLFRESRDGVDVKHYVGYFNGEVASCASLGIYGDMGILINTAVVPEFRRKGIHTTMMRHRLMVSKQNGCRIAFYQTDADNESSIGTGKKVGFTETFRRRIYTKDL